VWRAGRDAGKRKTSTLEGQRLPSRTPIVVSARVATKLTRLARFHHRRLLHGYRGYWPAGFPEWMALAERLPDPGALAALRCETSVEAILVHTALLAPTGAGPWLALAERPNGAS